MLFFAVVCVVVADVAVVIAIALASAVAVAAAENKTTVAVAAVAAIVVAVVFTITHGHCYCDSVDKLPIYFLLKNCRCELFNFSQGAITASIGILYSKGQGQLLSNGLCRFSVSLPTSSSQP